MNLLMLPMWLLSGSFFSYERFPEAFWPAIRLLPLTAVNDALRALFRGEALLAGVMPELLVLAAWGLGSFAIAVRRFRWQ
jgi:ABC-type multidrug transport system permease subunit